MTDKPTLEETDEAMRFMTEHSIVKEGFADRATARKMVNRWLEQVKAEAWDKGFADGVNHDIGDWENAPSIINNPYRQETNS